MVDLGRFSIALTVLTISLIQCQGATAEIPELAKDAQKVLKEHCYKCHGENGVATSGLHILKWKQLTGLDGSVVAQKPDDSSLYEYMSSGAMPPDDDERVKVRPSESEIALIKSWILAGAPNFEEQITREFVSPQEVINRIEKDLKSIGKDGREYMRYFTLAHLYNAGIREDELYTYRMGLSKLVNSLSWSPKITIPTPVDSQYTIYRIDVRDYQWDKREDPTSTSVWDAIVSASPYNIRFHSKQAQFIYEQTKHEIPFVRADWFVAAASRPPLYHYILDIPEKDTDLEKRLGVNVAANIEQGNITRAGFSSSGVSDNNRLIERHESKYGAYWKSYDFAGSQGKQLLTNYPLGPGDGKDFFRHDGGEIIFSLPNGLQAYMLTTADGKRINKGPTRIVKDPDDIARDGGAVVNGISCMHCHDQGMIRKKDEIRSYALANAIVFKDRDAVLKSILAVYKAEGSLNNHYDQDAYRHMRAANKAGSPAVKSAETGKPRLVDGKPIVRLSTQFQNELDLNLAASEAGVAPEIFLTALRTERRLAEQLGLLNVPGKRIKRDTFVAAFPLLTEVLKIGDYLEPTELKTAVRDQFSKGLIAYFPFDGNALDKSGNENHGQLAGNPVFQKGVEAQALSLDGVDDHVFLNQPLVRTFPFTWSLWIRTRTNPGAGMLLGIQQPPATWSPVLGFSSSTRGQLQKLEFGVDVKGSQPIRALARQGPERWMHIVVTCKQDGSSAMYFDGVLKGQRRYPAFGGHYKTFVIGGYKPTRTFSRLKIDCLRIYARALSTEEVAQLHKFEKPSGIRK